MVSRSEALYITLRNDLSPYLPFSVLYENGELGPDATRIQFEAKALLDGFLKKFAETVDDDADARALDKFLLTNDACRDWKLSPQNSFDEVLLGEFRRSVDEFWYKGGYSLISTHHDILSKGLLGPGSNLLGRSNSLYSKLFASPLSCTDRRLYTMYEDYVRNHSSWYSAELARYSEYGAANVVEGSQVHFVPKTNTISRTICIEPSLNMFYQLGFGKILESRIQQCWNIKLEDQPNANAELARIGSVDESFATIDLSSASDSISLAMLKWSLPKPFYDWLCLFRCKNTSINGKLTELHMVSSMGNGSTFPLETFLFCSAVTAVFRARGLDMRRNRRSRFGHLVPGNFGVFGDDIIVPTELAKDVIRLLNLLGFQVNNDKTFTVGPFRESCGSDYFNGNQVRAFYLKGLKTNQDHYVAINGLNLWSARSGIPLPDTMQHLFKWCRDWKRVPQHENPEAGIRVALRDTRYRYNSKGLINYQRSVPRISGYKVCEDNLIPPRGAKKLLFNPFGIALCYIGGYITQRGQFHMIGRRLTVSLYETKKGFTPNWDAPPPDAIRAGVNSFALERASWSHFPLSFMEPT